MWETSCRVVPSAGLFSKEVQDHLTSRGRWKELRTRPRMTRVSRDLAETISTVWIRLEYERQRQHLSLGRLSQLSHECQRSSLEEGWAQRRIKLEFDASWTISLKVHVENKTLFVLLFCFPPLSRVKISWVPSSQERNGESSKDGRNEIWRSLQAWFSSRLHGSNETDTFGLDAKLSGEETL